MKKVDYMKKFNILKLITHAFKYSQLQRSFIHSSGKSLPSSIVLFTKNILTLKQLNFKNIGQFQLKHLAQKGIITYFLCYNI